MRIAGTVQDSIVDGPGFRFTVFTQGCSHHCPGCHNPQTHDPSGGTEHTVEELLERMRSNPLTDGLTLSGGEPFEQPEENLTRRFPREKAVARLQEIQRLKAQGLSIPEIKALLETKGFHPEEF